MSFANRDGYETRERPPRPGNWGYAESFYRVDLRGYRSFIEPLSVGQVLERAEEALRAYITENRAKPKLERRLLFLTIQGNRLQLQNGGYLSELDEQFADIVLEGGDCTLPARDDSRTVYVGERTRSISARIGQGQFSRSVRSNYGGTCCFPSCTVDDREFLVGAHIARWSDDTSQRGRISNGLCLCLIHDKAFELGLFTLREDYRVVVNEKACGDDRWVSRILRRYDGQPIKLARIRPSQESIFAHWRRIGFSL